MRVSNFKFKQENITNWNGAEALRLTEAQQEAEEKRRKIKCPCGYDPHSHTSDLLGILLLEERLQKKDGKCNSKKQPFLNHITFPPFELLSNYDTGDLPDYHWSWSRGDVVKPRRHWATLLEIFDAWEFRRKTLHTWNQYGQRVAVHFYHEDYQEPTTFKWSDVRIGHTLAILYPTRHLFMDSSRGIRQEDLDSCFVFRANLAQLEREAQKLINSAEAKALNRPECTCFACGKIRTDLKTCGNCHLARYCDKVGFVNLHNLSNIEFNKLIYVELSNEFVE